MPETLLDPAPTAPTAPTATPTDRLLTGSLLVAPLVYLAADTTYAANGWDDPAGAVLQVLGAVAYGLVVLRVAAWLPGTSRLAAALVLTAVAGLAGNVAYGFDAIQVSQGATALVDQTGAAVLVKPLGLVFPLSLLLVAVALRALGRGWQAVVVGVCALLWPVAHIADLGSVAVPVDVALVVALGSLARSGR